MSDADFDPLVLYFPVSRDDWRALHELAAALEFAPEGERLRQLLDEVEDRAHERFAMVVWSYEDILDAAGRLLGMAGSDGNPPMPAEVGLTLADLNEVAERAQATASDVMTASGWDVLEDVVAEFLRERRVSRRRPRR